MLTNHSGLKAATIDSHRGTGLWGSALLDSVAHSSCASSRLGVGLEAGWAVLQVASLDAGLSPPETGGCLMHAQGGKQKRVRQGFLASQALELSTGTWSLISLILPAQWSSTSFHYCSSEQPF